VLLNEEEASEERIEYFPAARLVLDIEARFEALFAKRRTWTEEEITPYLVDLPGPKHTVEELLVKHTLRIQQHSSETPRFCSRRT
jgi:Sister chromatid cohesion protein Dcc1